MRRLPQPHAERRHSGRIDRCAYRECALLLIAILRFIPSAEDPATIVAALRHGLPDGGSWLALSRGTTDFHPAEVTGPAAAAYDQAIASLVLRPRAAIEAFFNHFTLEDPGLVQVPLWHPKDLRK